MDIAQTVAQRPCMHMGHRQPKCNDSNRQLIFHAQGAMCLHADRVIPHAGCTYTPATAQSQSCYVPYECHTAYARHERVRHTTGNMRHHDHQGPQQSFQWTAAPIFI